MVEKRKSAFRKKCFERDNFTCKKCKLEDKTGRKLEAHHIIPLVFDGKDELENLITLCFDCHHFAPNKKEDFETYLTEETEGTLTTLVQAFNKVRQENPSFFE